MNKSALFAKVRVRPRYRPYRQCVLISKQNNQKSGQKSANSFKIMQNFQKLSKSLLKIVSANTCKLFFKKTSRKQKTYGRRYFAFFQRKQRTYSFRISKFVFFRLSIINYELINQTFLAIPQ
jgi:hypothetical protein